MWALYHDAFAVTPFVASCTPGLESALQDTVFGVDAFMALDRTSRAFASFTLFTSVFAMLAALPFNSASYAVVATRRRSLSAAQSALASAMRRSSCVLQATPPAASSASAATVMTTILPRCGFFFSAGPVGSSMVSSSMAFPFSVICSPCP